MKGASEEEKQRWLSKQGTDWSGAFGDDPARYMDARGKKRREPGVEPQLEDGEGTEHDPDNPSS